MFSTLNPPVTISPWSLEWINGAPIIPGIVTSRHCGNTAWRPWETAERPANKGAHPYGAAPLTERPVGEPNLDLDHADADLIASERARLGNLVARGLPEGEAAGPLSAPAQRTLASTGTYCRTLIEPGPAAAPGSGSELDWLGWAGSSVILVGQGQRQLADSVLHDERLVCHPPHPSPSTHFERLMLCNGLRICCVRRVSLEDARHIRGLRWPLRLEGRGRRNTSWFALAMYEYATAPKPKGNGGGVAPLPAPLARRRSAGAESVLSAGGGGPPTAPGHSTATAGVQMAVPENGCLFRWQVAGLLVSAIAGREGGIVQRGIGCPSPRVKDFSGDVEAISAPRARHATRLQRQTS
ncbi:hypothetical protein Purlil1_4297 [Purpureocillium lilacinum]|uniref:Uncharacterized protein n=1 Tax=Purpureocillium lilacinum TaxID=33203 RepID=A0ABR0C5N4_PURLI|nr:hypothetical protein Purlil1_4297 [Purpureocillium lilacinum]